jgi:hypothetical protein
MEPTERIYIHAVRLQAVAEPARAHNPRKPGHARIQKKWNKRFGYKKVQRVAQPADGSSPIMTMSMSRRTLQKLETAARIANAPTPEQAHAAWEDGLVKLCDEMIEQTDHHGHDNCEFRCADQTEVDYIKYYMGERRPKLRLWFLVNGQPV